MLEEKPHTVGLHGDILIRQIVIFLLASRQFLAMAQTPKDFNISIRINSQIYDYSDWEGYGGGFATDKGNATNQDVSVYCRSGVITYSPTVEIHTSSYGSSTTNDGHTLINEFHLNSMTLILKEFL